MPFIYYFRPASMTSQKYDQCIARLAAAGANDPAGRLYHAAHGSGDQLHVIDVWDSHDAFEQFGKTLVPILQELGVDPGTPEVIPVHNLIAGPVPVKTV